MTRRDALVSKPSWPCMTWPRSSSSPYSDGGWRPLRLLRLPHRRRPPEGRQSTAIERAGSSGIPAPCSAGLPDRSAARPTNIRALRPARAHRFPRRVLSAPHGPPGSEENKRKEDQDRQASQHQQQCTSKNDASHDAGLDFSGIRHRHAYCRHLGAWFKQGQHWLLHGISRRIFEYDKPAPMNNPKLYPQVTNVKKSRCGAATAPAFG